MRLAPGTTFSCRALLFDMDGTLVDSTAAVERVWIRWGEKHGVDALPIIRQAHGVRAMDTLRSFALPGLDFEAEVADLEKAECEEVEGLKPISGAPALVSSLPNDRWAVVTSASVPLMNARLGGGGIPVPPTTVCAHDVTHGKPAPDCYLLGAQRLGFAIADCIVFEDAKAGLAAGHAAGARVIAIASTLSEQELGDQDWVPDMASLRIQGPDENGWMKLLVTA